MNDDDPHTESRIAEGGGAVKGLPEEHMHRSTISRPDSGFFVGFRLREFDEDEPMFDGATGLQLT